MFIAHLPAGYLLTKAIQHQTGQCSRALLWTGLAASIFPDLDLFYFYLIDNQQHLHHHYLFHLPLFWLALAAFSGAALLIARKPKGLIYVGTAFAGLMLHMALDSVAGGIDWLYPLAEGEVRLAEVPARYDWWVWNFVLHWTFLLEISIIAAAIVTWKCHAQNHLNR